MKLDDVFGIHEEALRLRAKRSEVLAANMANADTPGYKARDLDFGSVLKSARQENVSLARTSALHKQAWSTTDIGAKVMYDLLPLIRYEPSSRRSAVSCRGSDS